MDTRNNIPHWRDKQGKQQIEESKEILSPFTKRILIVDDDPDITYTFKEAFEEANRIGGNKTSFHVMHIMILLWLFQSSNMTFTIYC